MIRLFDWIRTLFRKNEPVPPPVHDTPAIPGREVRALLSLFTDNLWISDGVFKLVYIKDMQEFLKHNPVNAREYLQEFFDCDDYSYALMGDVTHWNSALSFGIVWGTSANGEAHAWNFLIDIDKQVWFVEPQNDSIFLPTIEKIWVMII